MKHFYTALISVCLALMLGGSLLAAEYHVNQDGTGDFTVIQDAIDAAVDGDTIIVHPGTYYENIELNGKNIVLRSVDPEDAGCVESTIIDGGQSGPVLAFYGTEDEACVLSGFTITNGKNGYGGGICGARKWNAPHTKASIENCTITENAAADAVGASGGGLMWCSGKISDCTISNNSAPWGAGLAECFGGSLENCLIIGNTADGSGGGLFRFEGTVHECVICDNYGDVSGGGLHECEANIERCTISGNSSHPGRGGGGGLSECIGSVHWCTISQNSSNDGAGLYKCEGVVSDSSITDNASLHEGAGLYEFNGDVVNCNISGNKSQMGYGGGLSYCNGTISNCTINDNSAWNGGGLARCELDINNCTISGNDAWFNGGALESCDGALTSCVISDNTAGYGGAVYQGGALCFSNCLIIRNVAESDNGGGIFSGSVDSCTIALNIAGGRCGGLHLLYGKITNCIVWGNRGGGERELSTDLVPSHCCIRDWTGGGEGVITDDPLFVTGPLGDYYISCTGAGQTSDSPCIDAGSDTAENLGLEKFTTRTDGGFDKGIVDIGYHYPVYDVTIETSLNDDGFGPGELIEAFLSVENHGSEVVVDAFVALILPGGIVVCFGPDGAYFGVFPFATRVFLDAGFAVGPIKVFELTVPAEAPPGSYAYAAALSQAGQETFISTSVSSFTVQGN